VQRSGASRGPWLLLAAARDGVWRCRVACSERGVRRSSAGVSPGRGSGSAWFELGSPQAGREPEQRSRRYCGSGRAGGCASAASTRPSSWPAACRTAG